MKNQIITFIIGVLVGAIITAAIFLIFKPNNSRRVPDFSGINRNGERVRPNGENFPSNNERRRRSEDSTTESNNTNVDENKDTTNENKG